MILTLHTTPPITLAAPDLVEVGPETLRLNGEVPNMSVRLDNARGQLTEQFAVPPLRARAVLATGDGEILFEGQVQAVEMAGEITLELEA